MYAEARRHSVGSDFYVAHYLFEDTKSNPDIKDQSSCDVCRKLNLAVEAKKRTNACLTKRQARAPFDEPVS
jgi:hypothetical protein